jgi:hypothetical protein
MEYTHNLKIILVDNNSIIEDKDILNSIKDILCQNHTHKIEWNNQLIDINIKWNKKELNEIDQTLMGDLFSYSKYEFDSITLHHIQTTISKIDCKYVIKFYLSRIIRDKYSDRNCIGII